MENFKFSILFSYVNENITETVFGGIMEKFSNEYAVTLFLFIGHLSGVSLFSVQNENTLMLEWTFLVR